ncbi:hypothetical protein [Candidatus Lokiarchaeum ossiferum]
MTNIAKLMDPHNIMHFIEDRIEIRMERNPNKDKILELPIIEQKDRILV